MLQIDLQRFLSMVFMKKFVKELDRSSIVLKILFEEKGSDWLSWRELTVSSRFDILCALHFSTISNGTFEMLEEA